MVQPVDSPRWGLRLLGQHSSLFTSLVVVHTTTCVLINIARRNTLHINITRSLSGKMCVYGCTTPGRKRTSSFLLSYRAPPEGSDAVKEARSTHGRSAGNRGYAATRSIVSGRSFPTGAALVDTMGWRARTRRTTRCGTRAERPSSTSGIHAPEWGQYTSEGPCQ